MPEPITTTGAIFGALATLVGAVFGRARIESRHPYAFLDRSFEPVLQLAPLPQPSSMQPAPASPGAPPAAISMMPLMERPLKATLLTPEKAAHIFIKYMQESKATGVFAYDEIDDFWQMACDQLHIVPLTGDVIREQLETLGYFIGRKQLSRDYPEVKIRTGRSRATLYRIPTKARSAARPPSQRLAVPGNARPSTGTTAGQRPASVQNSCEINPFLEAA